MKTRLLSVLAGCVFLLMSLSLVAPDNPDPGYIKAFGNGTVCVSKNGYPKFGAYDASQFEFHDGKFYIERNGSFSLRAFLPAGKTYGDLVNDFVKRKPHDRGNRGDKIIWRIFASHDKDGKPLYDHWPPRPEDMLGIVTYKTSPKELCFGSLNAADETLTWNTSGVDWNDNTVTPSMLCGVWLQNAKPGWQLYIVHTVGYLTLHEGDDHWVVDNPICTSLVEVK